MKGKSKEKTCIVSGKPISGDEAVHTEVGVLSQRYLPAYNRALDEVVFEYNRTSPSSVRKVIKRKLSDADYVRESLQRHYKNEIVGLLQLRVNPWGDEIPRVIVDRIRSVFLQGVDFNEYNEKDDGETGLHIKRALGCMRDDVRTLRFCEVIMKAIEDQESEKNEIEVVDAGCGPAPIFGIVAALKSDKVKATCLEINPYSAEMAQRIVENMGLEDRVRVLCVDAAKYKHDKDIDVLVSETMFAGLTNGEKMVQILENLSAQVCDSGEVIPKKVTIEAGITELGKGPVDEFSLPLRQVYEYEAGQNGEVVEFFIDLKGLQPNICYELVLASKVELGRGYALQGNDSVITMPTRSGTETFVLSEEGSGKVLHVSYAPGSDDHDIFMDVYEGEAE